MVKEITLLWGENKMRQLIKYFSTKKYAEMFKDGKLYMNSLSFFWENGFEEQRDLYEGISDTLDKSKISFPIDVSQIISGDVMFRLEAYRYCNLYCFYRVDISDELFWNAGTTSVFPDTRAIRLPDKSMESFGEYVGIVKNERKFVQRVLAAIDKDWFCVTGDVRYKERKGVLKSISHGMDMASRDLYSASRWLRGGTNRTSAKDCFDKTKDYEEQKEWRICLFRNRKEDTPYILDVGDLSDIVDIIASKEVRKYLIDKYSPCLDAEVLPQYSVFDGNVTRKELKEKLYEYDGGLGRLMFVIGA